MAHDLGRRGFLLLGAGTLLAGCSGRASPPTARGPAPRSSAPSTVLTASASPRLPAVTRWRPDPNDVEPAAKAAAVRLIEERGNGRRSALQVLEAQYGGLLADSACVLVVCRTWILGLGAAAHPGGATFDVRLVRSGRRWRVTAVHPSRPGPPAPRLTSAARRVLASRRIELPPASHADVLSGRVHDSVLRAMLTLAATYEIQVSVLRSGHPTYVFGTGRLSDHPLGRAFDTWRIDGHAVVDARTPRRLVAGYMEAAAAAGSYNVGGPYLLGPAPQFFTDATHRDHVHAGFTT
ncbi:MAG: hypothetical protein ACXVWU_02850 [Nocardioides sp.]